MAKARSKKAAKKATKKKFGWGGARPGAGRKASPDSGVSHRRRSNIRPEDFVLVAMRFAPEYGRMALKTLTKLVDGALELGAERPGFQIESYELTKGLLLVRARARDRRTLARGIQGFGVRVARALNRQSGKPGRAFADRYEGRPFPSSAERERAISVAKSGTRLRFVK